MEQKKIIHIDMDAFYAAVEQRDNPSLRGKPVIVGGDPRSRGVVSTASYEARKYGVHSAMPSAQAYRLCPHAVFVPPRFDAYKRASSQIRAIFHDYTDLVEPMSLDEAYLDVTRNKADIASATQIALEIKKRIKDTTGLTASAGVSYNKFIAKVASDYRKPDGMTVIPPHIAENFLATLPIGKFFGVGEATERKMRALGIEIGADLREWDMFSLVRHFGKMGVFYYYIVRGVDNRPVNPFHLRKSIGHEYTFPVDLTEPREMEERIRDLAGELEERMRRSGVKGRTVTLKVRYADFRRVTRSKSLPELTDDAGIFYEVGRELLAQTDAGKTPVRLLGLQASQLVGERCSRTTADLQPELPLAWA